MVNPLELLKIQRAQAKMQKQLEQIFFVHEKKGYRVVVRGDRRIESIEIEGEDQKELKDIINEAVREVNKKAEKQLRGQMGDLIPGLGQ